jgi:hypothetical protein
MVLPVSSARNIIETGLLTSPEQYNNVMKDLGLSGLDKVEGRSFHVTSLKEGGGMQVVDVWDSPEAFSGFGEKLMPILIKNGVNPPQPLVSQVHNVVK